MIGSLKLSIIIATFNSEKTLPLVLQSIENQTLPQKYREILLLDGGSQDTTLQIGKKFGCKIIPNPQTQPVYAKYLGLLRAKGKYILYLDHDEVLQSTRSLETKIGIMEENGNIKAVIGSGYVNPSGYPFINEYINEFGDPFSFFVYHLSKNQKYFIDDMKKKYDVVIEKQKYIVCNFLHAARLPLIELVAGGSMFDVQYMKTTFPQITKNQKYIPHIFYLLIEKNPFIAITKHDVIIHYSSESIRKYTKKILWRIKNNIYHTSEMGEAGFSGREKYLKGWERYKRFLFLPYAYSILFPLLDSVLLAFTRRDLRYFIHFPLTIYTANLIVYHYFLKLCGYKPDLRSYDESKKIIKN